MTEHADAALSLTGLSKEFGGLLAVDGVSLTVASIAADRFAVSLIPHTCAATTLGGLRDGALVNLEVDVIAKHVERLAAPHLAAGRAEEDVSG